MKIIEQSFEIIDRESRPPAELIELCGRTCYKSEDKITRGSADKFLRMLVNRNHLSVLEHGAFAVTVPYDVYSEIKMQDHETIRFMNLTESIINEDPVEKRYILSGNLRAWLEFLSDLNIAAEISFDRLASLTWLYCIPAYEQYFNSTPEKVDFSTIDFISPQEMTDYERRIHQFFTARLITNRGVTHELVRHRMAGFSQESTRYVNYGGKDMEFIEPVWDCEELISNNELTGDKVSHHDVFKLACMTSQAYYDDFLKHGWRPEQAREVLPNALKSEIVVTANKKGWKHIFSRRTSKEAHPQIRALMSGLQRELFTE